MLVWIVTNQRLDPVRPEDGEPCETTEAGEWSDQSNLGDGRRITAALDARFYVRLRVRVVLCTLLDLTCVLQ